jgi:Na+-translocating ferredoxin:NAD+ oxidoreductase RnfG subunit
VAVGAFLVLCLAQSRTTKEWDQAEAVARRAFPEATHFAIVTLPVNQPEKDSLHYLTKQGYSPDTLQLLVAHENDETVGYAVVDDARGKDQSITYCLIVDEKLAVKCVEILAYREPYGGEIQNSSWLKQFFGKQPTDELRPGREIKNITGATISSQAITRGVKKLLALLHIIQARLPHNTVSTK